MDEKNLNLGKWRMRIWPVHSAELPQFLPLFFIKFCASFNYTVLNSTKDTVIVTSQGGGAEVIPVLKGGVVIVVAFVAMLIYSKLSNKFSPEKVFYLILFPFILFFSLYGLVLYPYSELFSLTDSAEILNNLLGGNHQHWVFVYKYWMHSIFFVFSELWGGIMIGLLFWGFANQVTSVKSAARFYILYTAGGHLGTIVAGGIIYFLSNSIYFTNFSDLISQLMGIVVVISLLIIAIYWWSNKYVVSKLGLSVQHKQKSKTELSLKDSLLYVIRSPYLGLIALMVIGYGLSVNMVEVTFKAILKIQYPDPNAYQSFMGLLQTCLGFVSLFIALFIGGNFIRCYGWYASAQLTPIVLGITSVIFFAVYFYSGISFDNNILIFGTKPIIFLIMIGSLHNISCKAMKYCLFDPTKEMAYIPLTKEAKIKGKAAVDLVAGRFGKSGSSWIQIALIDLFGSGSILGVVPMLVPIVLLVVLFWFFAVRGLNKRFSHKLGMHSAT